MAIGETNRQEGGEQDYTEEEKQRMREETHNAYEWARVQNSPEQKTAEDIYAKLDALKLKNKGTEPTPEMIALEEEFVAAVHAVNEFRWAREEEGKASKNSPPNEQKN